MIVRKNSHHSLVWMELQNPKRRAMFLAKLPNHDVSQTLQHAPCWTHTHSNLMMLFSLTFWFIRAGFMMLGYLLPSSKCLHHGIMVCQQQWLLGVDHYSALLLPVTSVWEYIDHLLWTMYLIWCCIAVLLAHSLNHYFLQLALTKIMALPIQYEKLLLIKKISHIFVYM